VEIVIGIVVSVCGLEWMDLEGRRENQVAFRRPRKRTHSEKQENPGRKPPIKLECPSQNTVNDIYLSVALFHQHVVVLFVLVQSMNGDDMFVSQLLVQLDFEKQLILDIGKLPHDVSEYGNKIS
jgi:hypothetical protein